MHGDIIADIKSAFIPDFQTDFPEVGLVIDNSPFDFDKPGNAWVEVNIDFHRGSQVNLSNSPKTRYAGVVRVCVNVKEGTGTELVNTVQDWFIARFKYLSASGFQFDAPMPDGSDRLKGWYYSDMKFNFKTNPL